MSDKPIETQQPQWEEFWNGLKYFGADKLDFFFKDPVALVLMARAPEEIKRKIYAKCSKLEVAWPDSIPVDLRHIRRRHAVYRRHRRRWRQGRFHAEV